MNLTTISEISKEMKISTRTLRYYEQIGLIKSVKKEDYAYRTYDKATITRLQQILILRKLRIPLKQIALILQSKNTTAIIETFRQNLSEVDDEITALSTIREIINSFITRLNESVHQNIKLNLLDDTALLEAVDALVTQKTPLKEEKTIEDLNKADVMLKNKFNEVKYVNLAPAKAVAFNAVGKKLGEPESKALTAVKEWISKNNLAGTARIYMFNVKPWPSEDSAEYGMGCCATIPEDIEIPKPFYEMRLPGGTYAVISEYDGDPSKGWEKIEALMQDEKWEWKLDNSRLPGLEEHIERANSDEFGFGFYMPVMLPVEEKPKIKTKPATNKKDEIFNELVNQQSPGIKEWFINLHKLLIDNGCKFTNDTKRTFTYRKNKRMICKIKIDKDGCSIRPNTTHIANSKAVIANLTEDMFNSMKGGRGCGRCAENDPNFVHCAHGGPYKFTYNNEEFERCRYFGFNFPLDDAKERELLKKWIELELVA